MNWHRNFIDLDYSVAKQRKAGLTLSMASNGGEGAWISHDLLKVSTVDALKFVNDEYLAIRDRFPGEFELIANAHALEESCRPVVEERILEGGARAIAVSSSYDDGTDRIFLDSPRAEWLWEFAVAYDLVVHIHPPMLSVGHELLMQYRLNQRLPSDYFKTNILVDTMGFNPIGVRAVVELCGVDRVVFGSDFGAIPYGMEEHIKIFRLGMEG